MTNAIMDFSAGFWETALRLVLAVAAGGCLGWEREFFEKPAGLRTHMLVALGAALFMIIGMDFSEAKELADTELDIDPLRVLQGILGGIGFLGAGAIIQAGGSVRGLTTAASIWLSAAFGVASGMGFYTVLATGVVLALVILVLIGLLERILFKAKAKSRRDSQAEQ